MLCITDVHSGTVYVFFFQYFFPTAYLAVSMLAGYYLYWHIKGDFFRQRSYVPVIICAVEALALLFISICLYLGGLNSKGALPFNVQVQVITGLFGTSTCTTVFSGLHWSEKRQKFEKFLDT